MAALDGECREGGAQHAELVVPFVVPIVVMTSMTHRLLIVAWHNVERTWSYPAAEGAGVKGFEQQLRQLCRLGTVVPLAPALRQLSTGQPLPSRAIALTFDDGYRDNLEHGVPVLERLGLPATFFLVPGILSGTVRPWWEEVAWALAHTRRATVAWDGRELPIGGRPGRQSLAWLTDRLKELDEAARRRGVAGLVERLQPEGSLDHSELFLDWDGARELVRRGFTVGAHSMEHAILARETSAAQLADLVESRRCLEAGLGVAVDLLAYPNGTRSDYSTATVDAARRAGYTHALTARAGWNSRATPIFEVRRVMLEPHRGLAETTARRVAGKVGRVAASRARRRPAGDRPAPVIASGGSSRTEVAALESLADEWPALAARSGNVFATYEWASSWWRHHGQGHRPLVTACRSADGRLVAILPLYLWSVGPLRVLRFIGHGAADDLGPIHADEDRDEAGVLARKVLAKLDWDMFVGEQLPARELWSDRLGAGIIRREGSPVLRAPGGGWPEYLAGRSPNFRQQLGRRERNLARRHQVAFRLVREPGQLPEAMDQLFRLHQLRWGGAGSAFLHRAAFHRDFAATALERGWLRLWLLELDDRPAAAWYGFRFGDVESYYQSGRDPAFDGLSAGFVLLAHTIRAAFDGGAAEYRFGRGQDPYKYRFTDEDPGLETIASTRGPAAGAALFAARRAYPLAKRRIGPLRWELT
jgi:peptidoglycan/xylan/chitin deacetylase (PgdA/CDA1 family)/CelD/BcsL family acetyltransferase involved in cellulose biosynthesis